MAKMTMAEYEGSDADKKADAAAVRKANKKLATVKRSSKPKGRDKSGSRWHLQNVISRPDME